MSNNKTSRFRPDLPKFYERFLPFLRTLSEEQAATLFEGTGLNFDYDLAPVEGVQLKSIWQNAGGKWLSSFKANKESDTNIWELIRADTLEELKNFRPKQAKIKRVKTTGEHLHLLSLADIHFGKEAIGETEKRVHLVVDKLLSKLDGKNGKKFLYVLGNDLLNTDFNQSTTANTPQFDFIEPKEVFRAAWKCTIEVIEKLLLLGTVEIIHVPSNHDYYRGTYAFDVVTAFFHNNENVTFDKTNKSFNDRQYRKFGENMLCFEHGELKAAEYGITAATEEPQMWASTTKREWFLGHIHHEVTLEMKGVKLRYLPSISASDKWHKKKNYSSKQTAQLFVYHETDGLDVIYQVNP